MIITEIIKHNGREFRRTYTTNENMILHKKGTNEYYEEAVDVISSNFEYEEVERPKEENGENQ